MYTRNGHASYSTELMCCRFGVVSDCSERCSQRDSNSAHRLQHNFVNYSYFLVGSTVSRDTVTLCVCIVLVACHHHDCVRKGGHLCLFFGVTCVFFLGVACVFFIVRKQQSRTRGLLVGPMHSPLPIPKPIPIPLHMHMLIYIYTCTYTCICICVHIHIHRHTHIPIHIYIYTYIHIYIYTYIHIYIYTYIHIYIALKRAKPDRNRNETRPKTKKE